MGKSVKAVSSLTVRYYCSQKILTLKSGIRSSTLQLPLLTQLVSRSKEVPDAINLRLIFYAANIMRRGRHCFNSYVFLLRLAYKKQFPASPTGIPSPPLWTTSFWSQPHKRVRQARQILRSPLCRRIHERPPHNRVLHRTP